MSNKSVQFRWHILLEFAAAMVAAEAYHVVLRGASPITKDEIVCQQSTPQNVERSEFIAEVQFRREELQSGVLVLGNIGPAFDGELEVTLVAKPKIASGYSDRVRNLKVAIPPESVQIPRQLELGNVSLEVQRPARPELGTNSIHMGRSRDLTYGSTEDFDFPSERTIESQNRVCSEAPHPGRSRLFFLQTVRGSSGNQSLQTPVQCRLAAENQRARIYVDEKIPMMSELTNLIDAANEASNSRLPQIVEDLVGPVDDIDGDGRLAIVLTADVEQLGTGKTPVRGLTRSSDFVRGMDRPESNQSDVVFLSSNLRPDDELKAVLAHEWCHAAVFSRRMTGNRSEHRRLGEDDWLNEALAHVVEVRASGCWNNLSHRVRDFAAHPDSSPLIVRDYYHSEFWRHDGCRGAAFLFLQWCVNQSGDSLFERLLNDPGITIESLEVVMGQSFPELFRGWTRSLGQSIACQISSGERVSNYATARHQEWKLQDDAVKTRTISIRGASSAYLYIECAESSPDWLVSVSTSRPAQLQASMIPVQAPNADSRAHDAARRKE